MSLNYDYWAPLARKRAAQAKQTVPRFTRAQWEKRDRILKSAGFLPRERFWLNQHSINHDSIKLMIADRRALKKMVIQRGGNFMAFKLAIDNDYLDNAWQFRDGRLSPFAMVDFYKKAGEIEEEYPDKRKRKKKDYKSPADYEPPNLRIIEDAG